MHTYYNIPLGWHWRWCCGGRLAIRSCNSPDAKVNVGAPISNATTGSLRSLRCTRDRVSLRRVIVVQGHEGCGACACSVALNGKLNG
jgi:carbonic anhydrase